MATLAASAGTGVINVSGSGHSGAEARIAVAFASADGRRRYIETRRVPVVAGAISVALPAPFAGGTIAAKAIDPATGATIATASNVSV